ncbi:MAG TPA: DUF1844 domain-containing protein [Bryobacteraceae bacterium]|nr:DUF1844 domain-containing protein [Bryobacteraceae bacterium]
MSDNDPNSIAGQEPSDDELQQDQLPMPPATFEFLVLSLKMQADMAMGLVHFGDPEDRPKSDMRLARHSIDMLGLISEKTKGNLTYEEQRLLENTLTELRFRFVQASGSNPE